MQDIDTSWHEDNIRQNSRPSQLKITDIGTAVLGWENCAI
jgi:hypothetical protein